MSKILMYQTKDNRTQIEVQFDKDTVWLNRQQISSLFDRDIKTIGRHIGNVFAEGELEAGSVVAKFATTASDGKVYQVEHYNLDMVSRQNSFNLTTDTLSNRVIWMIQFTL